MATMKYCIQSNSGNRKLWFEKIKILQKIDHFKVFYI